MRHAFSLLFLIINYFYVVIFKYILQKNETKKQGIMLPKFLSFSLKHQVQLQCKQIFIFYKNICINQFCLRLF